MYVELKYISDLQAELLILKLIFEEFKRYSQAKFTVERPSFRHRSRWLHQGYCAWIVVVAATVAHDRSHARGEPPGRVKILTPPPKHRQFIFRPPQSRQTS